MFILDKINREKLLEIEKAKQKVSINELKDYPFFNRQVNSLASNLKKSDASGIISEFKVKSPSKGIIHPGANVEAITKGYVKAGVSGLSVLTDQQFFGGSLENLVKARKANPKIPILRKDFILDPYQIYQARAFGADIILLIAASLTKSQMEELSGVASDLNLEVLAEVHREEEIEKVPSGVDLIGVNNRDLKTFKVDIETSVRLFSLLPSSPVKISESGISSVESILKLKKAGYLGFLLGENFMKAENPAEACSEFIKNIRK